MTLSNHIGVFVLLLLAWELVILFERKSRPNAEYVWLPIGLTVFCIGVLEAFYWTFKIFF